VKSKSIFEHFQELPDPREDNRRQLTVDDDSYTLIGYIKNIILI
jgi:hypothetical protein